MHRGSKKVRIVEMDNFCEKISWGHTLNAPGGMTPCYPVGVGSLRVPCGLAAGLARED